MLYGSVSFRRLPPLRKMLSSALVSPPFLKFRKKNGRRTAGAVVTTSPPIPIMNLRTVVLSVFR